MVRYISTFSTVQTLLMMILSLPLAEEGKIPYLGEVGTEEFLMKLTSQITEMVSAKFSQGGPVL